MKPNEAREIYYFNSGKASDIVRQLGLAAIAIAWVFKTDQAGHPVIPRGLIVTAAWAIITLSLDALQYLYATAAWGILQRRKELLRQDEFLAPAVINWPTLVFFWAKCLAVSIAYSFILKYLTDRLETSS